MNVDLFLLKKKIRQLIIHIGLYIDFIPINLNRLIVALFSTKSVCFTLHEIYKARTHMYARIHTLIHNITLTRTHTHTLTQTHTDSVTYFIVLFVHVPNRQNEVKNESDHRQVKIRNLPWSSSL